MSRKLVAALVGSRPPMIFRSCIYCGLPCYGRACRYCRDLLRSDPSQRAYVAEGEE